MDILQSKIESIEKFQYVNSSRLDDIYGLTMLQTLLIGYPYLPFTGSSLRPYCIAQIINDILVNDRLNIIEFGSGLSTILIARLIKKNNLKGKLLSIDHNKAWFVTLSNLLESEGLTDIVDVCYAPLDECELGIESNYWYDLRILRRRVENNKFDLVIIDGPPAWEANKLKARYPALSFISENLTDRFSIYLDDANRPGEKAIIELWEKEYGIKFGISANSLAYYSEGNSFFTHPLAYH